MRLAAAPFTSPIAARIWPLVAVALVAALALTSSDTTLLYHGTTVGVYALAAMGLNVLLGYCGQPSLGQGALIAVGAYVVGILTVDEGWTFWTAAAVSIPVGVVFGIAMGLPALRLSSWYFALFTMFFTLVVAGLLTELKSLTHGFDGIVGVPRPDLGGGPFTDGNMLMLVLAIDVAVFLALGLLARSRTGRAMVAIRDCEPAALANGISSIRTKAVAFAIGGATAGLAGALLAAQKSVITPDDFPIELSIFLLVVVVLGGAGLRWGPIIGSVLFFFVPELLTELASWRLLIYGVALLTLMYFAPTGVVGLIRRLGDRLSPATEPQATAERTRTKLDQAVEGAGVRAENVVVRFGGVTALDGIGLEATAGEAFGIVGPNGSGKTTFLNAVSGFQPLDEGRIDLGELDITRRGAVATARLGIARTFQTPKLMPDLSVKENVLLGRPSRLAGGGAMEVDELLDFVGLTHVADTEAGVVPHGQQRLLEIARALAGGPKVVLLDEPAAGLALNELDLLADVMRGITASGTTLMLVEHHLDLVVEVCDRVAVFDQGRVLAEGDPDSVFKRSEVVAAYVGGTGVTN